MKIRRFAVSALAVALSATLIQVAPAGAYTQSVCKASLAAETGAVNMALTLIGKVPSVLGDRVDVARVRLEQERYSLTNYVPKVNSNLQTAAVEAFCKAAPARTALAKLHSSAAYTILHNEWIKGMSDIQLAVIASGSAAPFPMMTRTAYASWLPYVTATKTAANNAQGYLAQMLYQPVFLTTGNVAYIMDFTNMLGSRVWTADNALKAIPH